MTPLLSRRRLLGAFLGAGSAAVTTAALSDTSEGSELASVGGKPAAGWMTEPLIFPNNVNTILQRDIDDNNQNIALYDADDNFLLGPGSDLRIGALFNTWLNLDKRHFFDDFIGNALDPRWLKTQTGGGSIEIPAGDSCVELRSGLLTAGDAMKLSLPGGMDRTDGRGSAGLFVVIPEECLRQEITLGYEHDGVNAATDYVRFRATEGGVDGAWVAECGVGGVVTSLPTGVARDALRHKFLVDMREAGRVLFYISDQNNNHRLTLRATISTNLPAATTNLRPFVKVASYGAVSNRRILVDKVYTLRNS